MGGKNLLPIYMEEKLANNYFRKNPYAKKEVIEANKQVKYDENFVDNEGLKSIFNRSKTVRFGAITTKCFAIAESLSRKA